MTFNMVRFFLVPLAVSCVLLIGCASESEEKLETSEVVTVIVQPARRGTIQDSVRVTGTVAPAAGAELQVTAPASGRILTMPKAEGDPVRKGDLLVQFEIPSLKADVASKRSDLTRAEARLETARSAATRVEGLLDRGIAARREVEDAHRDLAEAEATRGETQTALEVAELLLRRERVTAPFSGVIARRWHNPGDLVESAGSDPILRLIDPSRLQIEVFIPVSDLPRITVGGKARVIAPGANAEEEAVVRTGPAAVDSQTGSATIRLTFSGPTKLPAGTPVQVVVFGKEHRDALLVPEAAIVHEGTDSFLVTVDGESHARRRLIEVGMTSGGEAEILSGLSPGESVIVQGHEGLPDGAEVTTSGS